MKNKLLNYLNHRNAPLPKGPWMMYQRWENLLCMHIPADAAKLISHIPKELELDLYGGEAWISIFPFKVNKLQLRGLPRFPYFHEFLELNVRTYVKYKNVPGIYFFSLDAEKIMPVIGARLGTLPYYKAKMNAEEINGWTEYYSRRQLQRGKKPYFKGRYRPVSKQELSISGTLDYWLFERYYLFNTVRGNIVSVGIHHLPWKPAKAAVTYETDALNSLLPGEITGETIKAYYVESLDVLFWPPEIIRETKKDS
ncbi:DUF2071 domain-containing protein [Jeotgalicoccus halotolerans]|uniref:DUF2071 domain-containing protein n=1 Tax=Jeotgalicoccus nanhaiensis TaxID=568603 RepID=A0ABR9XYT5_9STAP|nr:DUF2071 domain-containing protein [Jeotgalicoccus nanhaiensis]MBF0753891.1 DUF2071 domain-containing protein [Jeotgalicoccus nanhaiensis]